jgi:hypothetical protein
MEHSYIGNTYVRSIEWHLANEFYGYPFVWVGDYADAVETRNGKAEDIYTCANKFIYKDYDSDSYEKSTRYKNFVESTPKMWDGVGKFNPYQGIPYFRYLVNFTKKEYCVIPKYNPNKWLIHPLPLLTCFGNGRGCGDYHKLEERVGSWAFDCIGITNDKKEIVGFTEIDGNFEE